MKNGFLGTLAAFFATAGMALAQPPYLGSFYPTPQSPPPPFYKATNPAPPPTSVPAPQPVASPNPAAPPASSAPSPPIKFLPDSSNSVAAPPGRSLLQRVATVLDASTKTAPTTGSLPSQPASSSDRTHGPGALSCREVFPCQETALCGPPGRFWASAEYLLWWFEGNRVPPLVTTSPPGSAGALGAPGTTVLFGGSRLEEDAHSGGRFTLGYWLNQCQTIGVEAEFFFLGSRTAEFTAGGSGLPGSQVIARPVVNGLTGMETAELVNFPGAVAGNLHVASSSRLEGAGVSGLANLCCSCCYRLDFLAGFRYLELREGIGIAEDLAVNPSVPTIGGSTLAVADQFDTRNRFYGGQLGTRAEYRWGKVFLDLTGSVALGTTHEQIAIEGSTVITPAGGARTALTGGILALPTNSGHFSRDVFAVVPELGLNVGYQLTNQLRAFVGYSFLYWSNVARPGDVIDRTVNLTQIPSNLGSGTLIGPARPAVVLKDTDFWAQGINFGLAFRY